MSYNGHKNWQYWNVSLWISNTESLDCMALDCLAAFERIGYRERTIAAREMVTALRGLGDTHTPDGARYTVDNVRAAMRGQAQTINDIRHSIEE